MKIQETIEIPVFPLKSVLFPRGKIALQIFEQRYVDMISQCLQRDAGFGICLLMEGEEVVKPGRKQSVHRMGTYANVVDWDQLSNGLLGITVEGEKKFTIEECWVQDDQLLKAKVKFCQSDCLEEQSIELNEDHQSLVDLLHHLEKHPLIEKLNLQVDYENLWELGWRLSELIPIDMARKQELLELDDAHDRIHEIEKIVSELVTEAWGA